MERQLYGHEVAGRTLAYRMTVRSPVPTVWPEYLPVPPGCRKSACGHLYCGLHPVDLEEYGVGEPRQSDRYFRTADLDLIARSSAELEDAWQLICADRDELVRTLHTLEDAQGTQVSSFGNFGDSVP